MKVELIDKMGTDLSVVNAARVSYSKTKKTFEQSDEKLIKYLAEHEHWSPFAHASMQFRIKAPIFVARQLVKHQVGLVWNEVSRRYVDFTPEFYAPEAWRKRAPDKKQGSLNETIDNDSLLYNSYWDLMTKAEDLYSFMLEKGVAPEQARMVLPQSMMTEWYWTGSLAAFARVVTQRLSEDAQYECRVVAEKIDQLLVNHEPISYSWSCLTKRV